MLTRTITTKRKEPETPLEIEEGHRNVAYCVGGFFCGQNLTKILDSWMLNANNKSTTWNSRLLLLPMTQMQTLSVFIAMFVQASDKTHCILFNRYSGDRLISEISRIKVRFEIQPNALWDDGYVAEPKKTTTLYTLSSVDATTFALTPEFDNMANFNTKDSTLLNRSNNTLVPNILSRCIATKCSVLQRFNLWSYALCTIQEPTNGGSHAFSIFNMVGRTTHCVRIVFGPNKCVSFQSTIIDRLKRCTDELELGSLLWDGMSSTELTAFTTNEFETILNQTQDVAATDKPSLMEPTARRLSLEQDGERCQTWMRFVRSQLAPKTCFGINFVTIKLLHIPLARCKFELEILEMKSTDTPVQPRIMFHGVRGEHVTQTVDLICKRGFNSKYTQNCVYGAGGTYCSPQIACALDYTTNTANNQKFVFVCMVVPGKVCYSGQVGQQMAPDQHSWAHDLDNGHQIYCSETILPFALLTFVP